MNQKYIMILKIFVFIVFFKRLLKIMLKEYC